MKLEQILSALKAENEKLQDTVNSLKKQLCDADYTISDLQGKFNFDALYAENKRLHKSFSKIQVIAQEKLAEAERHKKENRQLSQVCLSLQEDAKRARQTYASEIEYLNGQLVYAAEYAAALEAENQQLLGEQFESKSAKEYNQLQEENSRLRGAVTRLSSLLDIATYGAPDREGAVDSMEMLRKEYTRLKQEIEKLFCDNAALCTEINELRRTNAYISSFLDEHLRTQTCT